MSECLPFSEPEGPHSPHSSRVLQKLDSRDLPGGPAVKNLLASAGDMGSTPGRGTKTPHAGGQLSGSHSVASDSLRPHELHPARLLCLRGPPGKNTGVGSPALFQGIFPTQGLNLGLLP